jgi:histone acetyltransferase (RNA polymerase elongator complex component)
MTQILEIIMSETYDFKDIILTGKVTLRNHSNCSHCFRFKRNACSLREYHVTDFSYRTLECRNGEHWAHEGAHIPWNVCESVV